MLEILGIKLYDVKETAKLLGVNERTIRLYITEGKIPARKLTKKWHITEDHIKDFLQGNYKT